MAEQEAIEEACEIARLPEELLSAALARTTRRDACRAAADSDAVWACFLPRGGDLPPLPDGELPLRGKKELYLRLSGSAVLLPGGLVSMWLDREIVAKCYMVSARALSITWGGTPQYWSWIPLADSRFSESANLINVCWLDIRGKIHSKMLSQGSAYAAYMVYKLADDSYGLESPVQDAWISVGGTNLLTRKVCLHVDDASGQQGSMRRDRHLVPPAEGGVALPQRRADGWIELSLGKFICEEDEDDDVSFGLKETVCLNWKRGLIVQGIEIRCIRNHAD